MHIGAVSGSPRCLSLIFFECEEFKFHHHLAISFSNSHERSSHFLMFINSQSSYEKHLEECMKGCSVDKSKGKIYFRILLKKSIINISVTFKP